MLPVRLNSSKGLGVVCPLLGISSQNYKVCKECLIKRYIYITSCYPRKLKNGLPRIVSSPIRWQTDGPSRNGANNTESKTEYKMEQPLVGASTSTTDGNDSDGKLLVSFDYKEGLPLHHQLKKCMEDGTLRITNAKGEPLNLNDERFTWPVFPKRKDTMLFEENEKLIEEEHALRKYFLLPRHLKNLRSIKKRNAYYNTDKKYVKMYAVSDIREKTVEVFGSMDKMLKQRKRRSVYSYEREDVSEEKTQSNINLTFQTLKSASGKVVLSAIAANLTSAAFKCHAWYRTGSFSMFAEMIHSLIDAINQVFMLFGLYSSNKAPDVDHPYGYKSAKYVFSFTAGIAIFFFGGAINGLLGVRGLVCQSEMYDYSVYALSILIGTTCVEAGSLIIAFNEASKKIPGDNKIKGLRNFIQEGVDPSITVVLLEDFAAVLGNFVALGCYYIGSVYPSLSWIDALGSVMIGGILCIVGGVIVTTNFQAIVEKSAPPNVKEAILNTMESDPIVRSVHDMKVVNDRVKAEIDFNGREITKEYLLEQNMASLLQEMQFISNEKEAEEFLLHHGGEVVNQLGKGVDGLETRIKARHPKVRHVDLESL
ncbi:proton-coupled zinc antiporter SLC30A9, mitochondrial-like [Ylistrum balloti]|uniref:proton-coupled zinc antiporter SLC30A9, mitochondrial-like n=1 Tax=Ylistrum balloti TaxID=509963 RepID=UPI002905944D|nr:proton-coupled zinc antiporter SLC30A9, mitochondrial-like [Ylistrum balloti]